jgi:predicted regulator of Ras-like GTPase activity (Roadblock/LC7/MglB family)
MGCGSVGLVPAATPQALADLTEISMQIETAVVFDREGTVVAATVDDEQAGKLAATALDLFRAAEEHGAHPGAEAGNLVQLDVALKDGSVFVVRDEDRLVVATTAPEPTVGLVFYDLKSCLRRLGEEKPGKEEGMEGGESDEET